MLAKDLKQLVKKQDTVTVRIIAPPAEDGENNMSDYGHSVADISTYLRTGMMVDITDACTMPPFTNLKDAEAYTKAIKPGLIYFVFHHAPHLLLNEKVADCTWINPRPKEGELGQGTAFQLDCYSGYDMIGFPADKDMSKLLEIVEKA